MTEPNDDNEGPSDRKFTKPAIRIDTLRNQLAATRDLLSMAENELEDLHVLAYDRQSAVNDQKVNAGRRAQGVDTHGDKRARDVYRSLGDVVYEVCQTLAIPAHDAIRTLREGAERSPRARGIQMTDLAWALAAQQRRIRRGDSYSPVRALPQPDQETALSVAVKEAEKHGRENARLRRLAKWLWTHQYDDDPMPSDLKALLDVLLTERRAG